jgi:RHS repeat-associated protein
VIAEGPGSTLGGNGTCTFLLRDRQSIRVSLDKFGNVLGQQATLPFGEEVGESGAQDKHHFTTYEADAETGLDYACHRFYSQAVGRFMSVDSGKRSFSLTDPQSWNRYTYARNQPKDATDPTGLDCDPLTLESLLSTVGDPPDFGTLLGEIDDCYGAPDGGTGGPSGGDPDDPPPMPGNVQITSTEFDPSSIANTAGAATTLKVMVAATGGSANATPSSPVQVTVNILSNPKKVGLVLDTTKSSNPQTQTVTVGGEPTEYDFSFNLNTSSPSGTITYGSTITDSGSFNVSPSTGTSAMSKLDVT